MTNIDKLIINSPYVVPSQYWNYDRKNRQFVKKDGRRPAGYIVASESSKSFDDPGSFVEIPLVNKIRPRINKWREAGYPGITSVTKTLLEHWYDKNVRENHQFFFCQLEAIETLIWLTEAPDSDKVGIDIPTDGGEFQRLCCKMATGSGKTIVMAMLIAWQVINKITYPQDSRYSKYVLIVAPGLTVKNRLQVLYPTAIGNYYDEFEVVPNGMDEKLRQGKFRIINWHMLNWETAEQINKRRSVDKRGPKSDEAYVREVLDELSKGNNIIVINDEAHHAWRVNVAAENKYLRQRDLKDSAEEATIWVGGLDRINKSRGIQKCYDFSATPFSPSGGKSSEETLYGWIVSDFGLNDAIESGLVKTPRVVIRDDGKLSSDYRSRLYHIYMDPDVKDDVNRKAEEHEPLPDLLINGYYLLGKDWLETSRAWKSVGQPTPPVMITVANRTETAARIKYAFDHKKIKIDELCIPERILHIDSKVIKEAEEKTGASEVEITSDEDDLDEPATKLTKVERAELLRQTVDTIGKFGKPGEQIHKVISVGMLSEGWDAKTVTHIMGLRAFSSQLLCEQVVGRGLRRTSYEIDPETNLFSPEYVNIFGVPFTFLPHETVHGPPPAPPTAKTAIEPVVSRIEFEISWPSIKKISPVIKPKLSLDIEKVRDLELNVYEMRTLADLAPVIDGKPDVSKIKSIDLESLAKKFRLQRIIFETAGEVFDQMKPDWKGDKNYLLIQIIKIVEKFIESNKIKIIPAIFEKDDLRRRLSLTLNMNKIVHHIWEAIRFENSETLVPIFDEERPIRSTGDMRTWYTGKPCEHTIKSHINMCVFDSTWEASEAFELDRNDEVTAWVKNDHLGFEIFYIFEGTVHKYYPDFIIKLKNGTNLIMETKGQDSLKDKTKRAYLDEWVTAINEHGGFGRWEWALSTDPADVKSIIHKYA